MSKGYIKLPTYIQLDVLFDHYEINDHERIKVEQFIHQVFTHKYGANITKYMPDLFDIRSKSGHLLAAVGMREANSDSLFLESYIECPIEAAISGFLPHGARPVDRAGIVELGNLASIHPGSARLIIIAMTMLLYDAGYEWVTFTAIPSLLNSFSRLGLNPLPLAVANKESLGTGNQDDWGSYYDSGPVVYAGRIADGYDCLIKSSLYPEILQFMTRWVDVTQKKRSMQLLQG